MSYNEPNNNLSQEAPQWMRDMFEELKDMFEGLFPDADKLDLEEMQRRLDEQHSAHDRWGQARIIVEVEARACPLRQLLRGVVQYLPHEQYARFRPRVL
jgi:hypothetical protein